MHPVSSEYTAITHFGIHGGSDHTTHDDLMGGRTAITTEALTAYNNLRAFFDLPAARIEDVGRWAFSAGLTNKAPSFRWGLDLLKERVMVESPSPFSS